MAAGWNRFKKEHLNLDELRDRPQSSGNSYLFKNGRIPEYPRPEIHVSYLKHDTDRQGLEGIKESGGFKGKQDLVWWGLVVGGEELRSAEQRLLQETYPDRTEQQVQDQQSFLGKFASSPAFKESPMFGLYQFTFPLQELLEAYSLQFCGGQQPVMRVYETHLYKQEVMYAVLVHSPANQEQFSEYPLLSNDLNAVCCYRDGRFIWRPEAMCETHRYELVWNDETRQMEVQHHIPYMRYWKAPCYVWDNVGIALHVEEDKLLKFDPDRLREKLKFCTGEIPRHDNVNLDHNELLERIWPEDPSPLQRDEDPSPLQRDEEQDINEAE
ncbi:hypothetical protein OYC64_022165 [Pagothenia borchgrevinki]|uniref:Uncharacterized protein n=1 Tax=Pagothenia borchgrevinki TaxID=8213 RepID=A0ABD2HMK4_PAGBO